MNRDKHRLIKGEELEKADCREAAGIYFKLQWKKPGIISLRKVTIDCVHNSSLIFQNISYITAAPTVFFHSSAPQGITGCFSLCH